MCKPYKLPYTGPCRVVLVGARRVANVEDSLKAATLSLTAEELERIEAEEAALVRVAGAEQAEGQEEQGGRRRRSN